MKEKIQKTFRIDANNKIVCTTRYNRNGFTHTAEFFRNDSLINRARVSYINRTWEQWNYETVIIKLLDRMKLSDIDKKRIHDICAKISRGDFKSLNKTTAMVASLGEVFTKTKKEKNAWKLRMIKAGMPGFSLPSDWDSLDENTKEVRLNKIIKFMKEESK